MLCMHAYCCIYATCSTIYVCYQVDINSQVDIMSQILSDYFQQLSDYPHCQPDHRYEGYEAFLLPCDQPMYTPCSVGFDSTPSVPCATCCCVLPAKWDRVDVAKLLLFNGANPNLKNWEGETAAVLARKRGNYAMTRAIAEFTKEVGVCSGGCIQCEWTSGGCMQWWVYTV